MVDKLRLFADNFVEFLAVLSELPGLCVFIFVLLSFAFYCSVTSITDSLFDVHRSKTAVRKIMKEYSFWQKILRKPHKEHCLHAKSFCIKIINYLYVNAVFFAVGLLIIIIECIVSKKLTISFFVLSAQFWTFDIPIFTINFILKENPFQKMSKYRFEKYHQTKEYEKLT